MKLPRLKRKLPKTFTHEDSLFHGHKGWIEAWHSCNTWMMYCVLLAIPAIYFQLWPLLPVLLFVGLMAGLIGGAIETKADKAYPYLEHTDAIGLAIAGFFIFIFCVMLFLGSFGIPRTGW